MSQLWDVVAPYLDESLEDVACGKAKAKFEAAQLGIAIADEWGIRHGFLLNLSEADGRTPFPMNLCFNNEAELRAFVAKVPLVKFEGPYLTDCDLEEDD